MFIEARINLSRFVVTGRGAHTSSTVTFPRLNLISLFAFCFNILFNFFLSQTRLHTRCYRDWSSDVCSSDLKHVVVVPNPNGSFWGKVRQSFRSNSGRKAQMGRADHGPHVRSEDYRTTRIVCHSFMLTLWEDRKSRRVGRERQV